MLGGIEAGGTLDFRDCEYLVGTSAGSIVAATLAAGKRPEAGEHAAREWAHAAALPEPIGEPGRRAARGELGGAIARGAARAGKAVATPFAPLALATTRPAGRLARAAVLSRAPRPGDHARRRRALHRELGARFDGRLRIAAVDRARGKRVMFGAPDEPKATVAEAVLASCAVPWIFAPVEIGGREYVDGGVWSPTNLDAVPGRPRHARARADPHGRRDARAPAHGERRRRGLRVDGAAGQGRERPDGRPRRAEPGGDRPEPDGPGRRGAGRRRRLRAGPPLPSHASAAAVASASTASWPSWWPQISPTEDYEEEAGEIARLLARRRAPCSSSAAAAAATPSTSRTATRSR